MRTKTETNPETEGVSFERYKLEKQYRFSVGITLLIVSCLILLVLVTVSMPVTLQQTLAAIAGLVFLNSLDALRRCLEAATPNSSSTIWGNTYHIYNNYEYANTINTYNEKQDLKEAAIEIQELLNHLSQTYPTTTDEEKIVLATEAVEEIENDPSFKKKLINAMKTEGVKALKDFVNHPAASFVIAFMEEWQEAEEKTRSLSEH